MNFTPLNLNLTPVGRLSTNLYPLKQWQPMHKRAHAYHVNMNTVALIPIDTHLILDAIGSFNCSAVIKGIIFDWKNLFDMTWFDFANLSILSSHGSDSQEINNTTVTSDCGTCALFRLTAALTMHHSSHYWTTVPQPFVWASTLNYHRQPSHWWMARAWHCSILNHA